MLFYLGMVAVNDSSVNINMTDGRRPGLTGSGFLPDGRLIVCDNLNRKLKLLSSTFTPEDSIQFIGSPWDVVIINDTTVVVSFIWRFQFVHVVPSFQLGTVFRTGQMCSGMDALNDTLYIICYDKATVSTRIGLLDFEGKLKGTIEVDSAVLAFYLTAGPVSSKIFISNFNRKAITCLSTDGKNIYDYRHSSLKGPGDLLVDDLDNIIVCDSDGHNLQIIDRSGEKQRNLLELDKDFFPHTLAYRRSDGTLVVGGQELLLVFKLTHEK